MADASAGYVVGVDLGGTRLRAALADRAGRIIRQNAVPTLADQGRDAVVGRIVDQIRSVLSPLPPSALACAAVAVPGPCDPGLGMVYDPPNLPGWGEVALQRVLEEALAAPVRLGNDANVAALAEHEYGSGKGSESLIYMTVSTGIGGGVIDGNRLILGAWGGAAEIGHITIDLNGPRCGCGNHGCLEAMASGTAIGRESARRLAAGAESTLRAHLGADTQQLKAEYVFSAAQDGDQLARDVVEWAAYNLGVGLANVMHLFDPRLIIIGGGVSNAWEMLCPAMQRAIHERAMPAYANRTRVVRSQLGDEVGLLGAVTLANRSATSTVPPTDTVGTS
jgi:glucokinase